MNLQTYVITSSCFLVMFWIYFGKYEGFCGYFISICLPLRSKLHNGFGALKWILN